MLVNYKILRIKNNYWYGIFVSAVFIVSCSREVNFEDIVEKDSLIYKIGEDKPYTGKVFEYHSGTGQLERKISYIEGKKDGMMLSFRENGTFYSKVNYTQGKKNGVFQSFHQNRSLESKVNYINGEKHGVFEKFYNNEQLEKRVEYRHDKSTGLYEEYYRTGELMLTVNYAEGIRQDLQLTLFKDGSTQARGYFLDGEKVGLHERFEPGGDLDRSWCYKGGKEVSISQCENWQPPY